MTTAELRELVQRMAQSPAFYRRHRLIEVSGDVVRYADVAADWQETDFAAMDAAWLRCVGRTRENVTPMRAWLERPRGASKTSDLACMASWALRFAPRRIKLIWCAGDVDQARLGVKAIQQETELQPWLALEVQRNIVRNSETGSELEVLTSDAATGYGQLVDGVLVDEIGNWADTESAQRFWQMVASTISKKRNCLCVCILNAGRVDSWQWALREAVREDGNWYFRALDSVPSWITERQLEEQRRLLPQHAFARLWENKWSSGTDEGLSPKDVDSAIKLGGPQPHDRDLAYLAGLDLAVRRDHAALVTVGINFREGKMEVVKVDSWRPPLGGDIDLMEVHSTVLERVRTYNIRVVLFDPHQAALMSQSLARNGVYMHEVVFNAANRDAMAKGLLNAFRNQLIKMYADADLVRDLLRISFAQTAIGYRLAVPRGDGSGHCDRAVALALCIPPALSAINSAQTPQCDYTEEILVA